MGPSRTGRITRVKKLSLPPNFIHLKLQQEISLLTSYLKIKIMVNTPALKMSYDVYGEKCVPLQ